MARVAEVAMVVAAVEVAGGPLGCSDHGVAVRMAAGRLMTKW